MKTAFWFYFIIITITSLPAKIYAQDSVLLDNGEVLEIDHIDPYSIDNRMLYLGAIYNENSTIVNKSSIYALGLDYYHSLNNTTSIRFQTSVSIPQTDNNYSPQYTTTNDYRLIRPFFNESEVLIAHSIFSKIAKTEKPLMLDIEQTGYGTRKTYVKITIPKPIILELRVGHNYLQYSNFLINYRSNSINTGSRQYCLLFGISRKTLQRLELSNKKYGSRRINKINQLYADVLINAFYTDYDYTIINAKATQVLPNKPEHMFPLGIRLGAETQVKGVSRWFCIGITYGRRPIALENPGNYRNNAAYSGTLYFKWGIHAANKPKINFLEQQLH